jgi:hypothetical protein
VSVGQIYINLQLSISIDWKKPENVQSNHNYKGFVKQTSATRKNGFDSAT